MGNLNNGSGGDSSMMIMVLVSGISAMCFSCVCGLGMWYAVDPTLNGFLTRPAGAPNGSTPVGPPSASTPSGSTPGGSTDSSKTTTVSFSDPVYIKHKQTDRLLAHRDCEKGQMGLECYNKNNTAWYWKYKIRKVNKDSFGTYYTVQSSTKCPVTNLYYYLTAWNNEQTIGGWWLGTSKERLKSFDAKRQEWYFAKASDGTYKIYNRYYYIKNNHKDYSLGTNSLKTDYVGSDGIDPPSTFQISKTLSSTYTNCKYWPKA